MRTLAVLVLPLALAACGRSEQTYPPQYEFGFMQACEAQAPLRGVCACTWARIEAEVPAAEFAALEAMPGPEREAHPLMDRIRSYRDACVAQAHTGSTEPAPAP